MLSFFATDTVIARLVANSVRIVKLLPSFVPTNAATGLESPKRMDLSPERQRARGRKGGPKGAAKAAVSRTQQVQLYPAVGTVLLNEFHGLYDPEGARAAHQQAGLSLSRR